jgi:hypothetical protein
MLTIRTCTRPSGVGPRFARRCTSILSEIMDKNISPVGWYLGTYLARFVEIGDGLKLDPEKRFPSWENTVIVKALSLEEAYDKVEAIGIEHAAPYKGGTEEIPVQWEYIGITSLLPIYEELDDGAEIMWASNHPRKLKNLRGLVRTKDEFRQWHHT